MDGKTGLKRTKNDEEVVKARLKTIGLITLAGAGFTLAVLAGADEGVERGRVSWGL